MIHWLLQLLTDLNSRMDSVVAMYAAWTYLIIFVLILIEPFPLLTPLLPSGSVILVAGAMASNGSLNPWLLLTASTIGATIGDSCNYLIGSALGFYAFRKGDKAKQEHENLERAKKFYDKYGAAALLVGRLLPFVRVIVPTLAGIGVMKYPKFLLLNFLGCLIWTAVFLLAGYFFGHLPIVRDNMLLGMILAGLAVAAFFVIHRAFVWIRAVRKKA